LTFATKVSILYFFYVSLTALNTQIFMDLLKLTYNIFGGAYSS